MSEIKNLLVKRKDIPYSKFIPYISVKASMITSKLTSKSQTTVPQAVRKVLGLKPGDVMTYEIVAGQVILRREENEPTTEDPFGCFEEWHGDLDEEAYADL